LRPQEAKRRGIDLRADLVTSHHIDHDGLDRLAPGPTEWGQDMLAVVPRGVGVDRERDGVGKAAGDAAAEQGPDGTLGLGALRPEP
jgi:hypothetical protein